MALTRRRSSLYDGIEYGGLPVRPVIDEFAYARTHSDHDSNTALFEVTSRRYVTTLPTPFTPATKYPTRFGPPTVSPDARTAATNWPSSPSSSPPTPPTSKHRR